MVGKSVYALDETPLLTSKVTREREAIPSMLSRKGEERSQTGEERSEGGKEMEKGEESYGQGEEESRRGDDEDGEGATQARAAAWTCCLIDGQMCRMRR